MDEFSNVSNALLGIQPANKVVGVKPLQKRDDRRRGEERHGQGKGMGSAAAEDGSNGSTDDSARGKAGPKDKSAEPRKVDVVV
jgi:hypothetical protein